MVVGCGGQEIVVETCEKHCLPRVEGKVALLVWKLFFVFFFFLNPVCVYILMLCFLERRKNRRRESQDSFSNSVWSVVVCFMFVLYSWCY